MASLRIIGGRKLSGTVKVAGNKNSAMPLMAAALLGSSPTTLTNVPRIKDTKVMLSLIKGTGAKVEDDGGGSVTIDPASMDSADLDPALAGSIRGSVVLVAPLLAKFGKVFLPRVGGDSIGERVIDTHMKMLSEFGADFTSDYRGARVSVGSLKAAEIFLEEASVTATEIALMLAASVPGTTVIGDAASEPHVKDLAEMLVKMGVEIEGAGTNIVRVKGAKVLQGVEHAVCPDHIEVGTFAIAAAVTQGDVAIKGVREEDLKMMLIYLEGMGVDWELGDGILRIKPSELVAGRKRFQTRPWPGFPTDLMSAFIVLSTQTKGTVLCHDWMYEWRIFFVDHLISMGADIIIADPHRVIVNGPSALHGDVIPSADIRAGGALVLAALAARGESVVEHAEMIERGYEDFDGRLKKLGAHIERTG